MAGQVWRSNPAGIFVVHADDRGTEAWSAVRLPFEPRGAMADLRASLRAALGSLHVPEGQLVHAVYSALDTGAFVDAENVLIYNVGPSALREPSRTGIRFERSYVVPRAPEPLSQIDGLHHHSYSGVSLEGEFNHWRLGSVMAAFDKVPAARIDRPALTWAAVRSHSDAPAEIAAAPSRFALRLTLELPPGRRTYAAAVVKPLLDGVICAFHAHAGPAEDSLVQRVSDASGLTVFETRAMLADQHWAALGARCLVRPFRLGIQWNPADEYCVAAEVVLGPEPSPDQRYRLSGTLHQVSAVASI